MKCILVKRVALEHPLQQEQAHVLSVRVDLYNQIPGNQHVMNVRLEHTLRQTVSHVMLVLLEHTLHHRYQAHVLLVLEGRVEVEVFTSIVT